MEQCDTPIAPNEIQAIIFDFDNVIVRGSEECKSRAWDAVFPPNSSHYQKLQEAQKLFAHGKGDRFDMIGHVLDVSTKEKLRLDTKVIRTAELYNNAVQKCITGIGIAQSDFDTLLSLKEKFPLYIISATPEEALHETLANLSKLYQVDLLKIFSLALGTPSNKVENFLKIQNHSSIPFGNMLMVGDGRNDYAAAHDVGSLFLGVTTSANEQTWSTASFTKITAIDELPKALGFGSL